VHSNRRHPFANGSEPPLVDRLSRRLRSLDRTVGCLAVDLEADSRSDPRRRMRTGIRRLASAVAGHHPSVLLLLVLIGTWGETKRKPLAAGPVRPLVMQLSRWLR